LANFLRIAGLETTTANQIEALEENLRKAAS
jgi:hypothetical protein